MAFDSWVMACRLVQAVSVSDSFRCVSCRLSRLRSPLVRRFSTWPTLPSYRWMGTRSGEADQKAVLPTDARLELHERDVQEDFMRGSGPGGQKVNKTSSCVFLRHIPSGITVKCQESRSQHRNRVIARRILQDKLEAVVLGEASRMAQEAAKIRARKRKRRYKVIKKHFKTHRDQLQAMNFDD